MKQINFSNIKYIKLCLFLNIYLSQLLPPPSFFSSFFVQSQHFQTHPLGFISCKTGCCTHPSMLTPCKTSYYTHLSAITPCKTDCYTQSSAFSQCNLITTHPPHVKPVTILITQHLLCKTG